METITFFYVNIRMFPNIGGFDPQNGGFLFHGSNPIGVILISKILNTSWWLLQHHLKHIPLKMGSSSPIFGVKLI